MRFCKTKPLAPFAANSAPIRLIKKALRQWKWFVRLSARPIVSLHFGSRLDEDQFRRACELLARKSVAAALVDLTRYDGANHYLDTVGKRGHLAPQAQKARSRGYVVRALERQGHLDDIWALHALPEVRQFRLTGGFPALTETAPHHSTYYGVFDSSDALVAYCRLTMHSNFAAIEELIGYRNRDGALQLLLAEIVCQLITQRTVPYLMHQGFQGTTARIRRFMRRAGFESFRVRYALAT